MPKVDSTRLERRFPAESELRPSKGRRVFAEVLKTAGSVAVSAIPGVGPAIAAAIPLLSRRGSLPEGVALAGESETLKYLELQRAIERETRMYETASNVMKAKHDATMSSIRNIKS